MCTEDFISWILDLEDSFDQRKILKIGITCIKLARDTTNWLNDIEFFTIQRHKSRFS